MKFKITKRKCVKKRIVKYIISKTIFNQKTERCFKIRLQQWQASPRAKKIKTLHAIGTKWGIRIYCHARILTEFTHKVREIMFKKYFKLFLVSKSEYLKQQGSHYLYPWYLSFCVVSGETGTKSKCDINFD